MDDGNLATIDLCGVWRDAGRILKNSELPRFSAWWCELVERARGAGEIELLDLAFVAAVTGAEELGDEVSGRLRGSVPEMAPLASHQEMYPELTADLATASGCKTLAYIASLLWPWLGDDDRELSTNELSKAAGTIYQETLAGAWWGNAPNSNWTSHLHSALGLAGLVLVHAGEEEAGDWVDMACNSMTRMLDLAGEEGAGIEGPGYWCGCYRSVQEMAAALKNTGKGDLYSHRFWERCVEFPVYMSRPDLSGLMSLGDTGYEGLGQSHFYYALAAEKRQGLAQWFGDRILEQGSPSVWDLMHYAPDVAPVPPEELPTCRVFSSAHLASFRSDWSRDATFVVLKGGSNAWSHCHLDLNSIFLDARGERLIVDPGIGPYSYAYFTSVEPVVSTSWHNTIVVDGADQRQPPRYRMSFDLEEGGDAYCRLSDYVEGDGIVAVRGDASAAYGDYLDRFHRDVVFFRPDCFVIFDDLLAREARTQRHYQWLLHSEWPMAEREEGGVEVRGQRSKCLVIPVLPEPYHLKFLTRETPAKGGEDGRKLSCLCLRPDWHHLWNVSPKRGPFPQWDERCEEILYGNETQFLVVCCISGAEDRAAPAIERLSGPEWHGVRIGWEGETMRAVFNPGGEAFEADGMESDGEKVFSREGKDGRVSWAAIRCRKLQQGGRDIVVEEELVTAFGTVETKG